MEPVWIIFLINLSIDVWHHFFPGNSLTKRLPRQPHSENSDLIKALSSLVSTMLILMCTGYIGRAFISGALSVQKRSTGISRKKETYNRK